MENLLNYLTKKQFIFFKLEKFKKNRIIFRENEKCKKIYFVKRGKLKINSFLNNGTEVVFRKLLANNYFGNHLIFTEENFFKGNVFSETDGELLSINKEDFLFVLKSNKLFLEKYLEVESENSKNENIKIKLLSLPSAHDRLFFLLETNKGVLPFSSISNLSKELFLTRETTSRLVNHLLKTRLIIKKRGQIFQKTI